MPSFRTPRPLRLRGESVPRALVVLLLTAGSPALADAQVVRGRVVDAETRAPLPTTVVKLLLGDSTITQTLVDEEGRFAIAAPAPGDYRLRAERIGYASEALGPVRLGPGVTDVQLRLDPQAIPLDGLIIATEAQIRALDRVGYYTRMREGTGVYVDRHVIDQRNAVRMTDLFLGMPGARVVPTPNGGQAVLLRGGLGGSAVNPRCPPVVWLDGLVMQPEATGFDWRTIHPSDIEAFEVYRSPAEVPAQYGGAMSACGVVLLWTRKGGR